jgi:hypothetical protein
MRPAEPGEEWVWCYIDEVAPGEVHAERFAPVRG